MPTQSSTRSVCRVPRETPDQALRRLAFQALTHGLIIYDYPHTREFYCSSHSQPDMLHRVTRLSCDCRGFIQHGRCSHYALLLYHLGELPEPTPPVVSAHASAPAVLCDQCGEPMRHMAGVSFVCACGATFSLNWQAADEIDRRLSELNQGDPDAVSWIETMLSPGGDAIPAGADPDHFPCRSDVADVLTLRNASANDIAAVLVWRADLQTTADRTAA